jgi:hypothetical protein
MAVTALAAGTWQPSATVNVFRYLGDGERLPSVAAVGSGAAAANGSLAITVTADANQPLTAVGPGPNGATRRVTTYAL